MKKKYLENSSQTGFLNETDIEMIGEQQTQIAWPIETENKTLAVVAGQDLSFLEAFRKISSIAIPMSLSFTVGFSIFSSGLMIGRLQTSTDQPYSTEQFKAAATIVTIFMNMTLFSAISPLFAMPVLLTNRLGDYREFVRSDNDPQEAEIKKQKISYVNRSGLIVSTVVSVPAFLVLFFSKDIAKKVFGQDDVVSSIAQEYLRPYAYAVPAVLSRMTFEEVIFSCEKSRDAMLMGLGTFTVGTLISVWLGFGGLGVNAMGARGIAYGYLIEAYLLAASYGSYVAFHRDLAPFRFFRLFGYNNDVVKGMTREFLSWSAPISFTVINELLVAFVIGLLAGRIGVDDQAAMSYMTQFIYLLFPFLCAFGHTNQQELGREIGARRYQYASQLARYFFSVTLIYLSPPAILIAAYPQVLEFILGTSSSSTLARVRILAPTMAVGVIADVGRYVILQQSRSLADPWVPTLRSMAGLWIGMLSAGLLSSLTDFDVYGIGAGYTAGILLATISISKRWWECTKRSYVLTVNNREEKARSSKVSLLSSCCDTLFSRSKKSDPLRHILLEEVDDRLSDHSLNPVDANAKDQNSFLEDGEKTEKSCCGRCIIL